MQRVLLRTGKLLMGSLVLVAICSGQASADLTNGGFDTGSFNPVWSLSGTYASNSSVASSGSNGYVSQSGSDYALIGGTSFLGTGLFPGSVSLSTTFTTVKDASYTLTFYLANNQSTSNEVKAFWNGTSVFDQAIADNGKTYTEYTLTEAATSTSTTVKFTINDATGYLALDSVSVVDPPPAAPEPSTAIAGLVGGLAMTGYVWRARRRAAHSAA